MTSNQSTGLSRIAAGDGRQFAIAGATLTWKVQSEDSGGRFCFFEQTLAPGAGVPSHSHSYSEAFYILSGVVEFSGFATESPIPSGAGDVIFAPPNQKHGFYNPGTEAARLLSISVGAHQRFFDAIEAADRLTPFSEMSPGDAMMRVAAIGAETDAHFDGGPLPAPDAR